MTYQIRRTLGNRFEVWQIGPKFEKRVPGIDFPTMEDARKWIKQNS